MVYVLGWAVAVGLQADLAEPEIAREDGFALAVPLCAVSAILSASSIRISESYLSVTLMCSTVS